MHDHSTTLLQVHYVERVTCHAYDHAGENAFATNTIVIDRDGADQVSITLFCPYGMRVNVETTGVML